MEAVTFAVNGSNTFHKIEPAKSLLHFAEFDFTYFWEQSIEAGRNARKTGRISSNIRSLAINSLVSCHPYVEACINTDFSSVVTDCIIAYICHSEGIGLEELWARCISPKSLYERDIFNRVSEYKTGRGINQWINIVRMQEYARAKMKFIYETEQNRILSSEEYRARKEYFDLSFAVAANETGCRMRELPSVKKYTPATLPDSVFSMGRMSKNIYNRLSDVLADAQVTQERTVNDRNRDQIALDAFSYVKDMERPGIMEMNAALEMLMQLPREIYIPDSFKAAVDLEFNCMCEQDIFLAKCRQCGRFFIRDNNDPSPYCNRVNSSGMTCAEQIAREFDILSGTAENTSTEENEVPAAAPVTTDIAAAEETPLAPVQEDKPSENAHENVPAEIPRYIEKRCQRVYNLLYRRIGMLISPEDFREWARYLSDMKSNLRSGNAEITQIEEFLDYWEDVISKSGRSRHHKRDAFEPNPAERKNTPGDNLAELFEEAVRQAEMKEKEQPRAEIVKTDIPDISVSEPPSEDGFVEESFTVIEPHEAEPENAEEEQPENNEPAQKICRPFMPPKYNTVLEAMLDGKYRSDEILGDSMGSSADDITVKGRKVKLPDWEKVSKN